MVSGSPLNTLLTDSLVKDGDSLAFITTFFEIMLSISSLSSSVVVLLSH